MVAVSINDGGVLKFLQADNTVLRDTHESFQFFAIADVQANSTRLLYWLTVCLSWWPLTTQREAEAARPSR